MRLRDIVQRINIDHRIFTDYALNFESPLGYHKAIVFEQILGFTKDNYIKLVEQIEEKILDAPATFHEEDRFGRRYTIDIDVIGVNGKQAVVRTDWFVPYEADEARLVTLYVRR